MSSKVVVGGLSVSKARHELHLNVKHATGLVSSVVIEGAPAEHLPRQGEQVSIGGLEGFPPESHTRGVVQKISHVFTGGASDFIHTTIVDIAEIYCT